jgi:hypothetical protein
VLLLLLPHLQGQDHGGDQRRVGLHAMRAQKGP